MFGEKGAVVDGSGDGGSAVTPGPVVGVGVTGAGGGVTGGCGEGDAS